MTIRRAVALSGLLAVLAGLWWGLRVDPAVRTAPGESSADRARDRSLATIDPAGAKTRGALGTILGTVTCRNEPTPASVELRRVHSGEPSDGADRTERLLIRLGLAGRVVRGPPLLAGPTGADGGFTLIDLSPGRYEIRAVGPEGRRGTTRVELRPPRDRVAVNVELPSGEFTLRGRVHWADGRPFEGEVWVGSMLGPTRSREVRTDREGRFAIPHLGPGDHAVSAGLGSRLVADLGSVRVPADGEVRLRIGQAVGTIEGRVLDDATGRPVAGARVVSRVRWYSGAASSAKTDGEGFFRVLHTTGGQTRVLVLAEGYSPAEAGTDSGGPALTIRLVRASAVFGRVLDAKTGRPVPGITVLARGMRDSDGATLVRTATDADGRYRIEGVAAGPLAVVACGGGRVSTGAAGRGTGIENRLVVTAPPGGEVEANLVVVPAVTVSGRVVDVDGNGAGDVVVTAHRLGDGLPGFDGVAEPSSITESDGSFRLSGVIPGDAYWLHADDGGDRGVRDPWFVVPAAGATGIEMKLPAMAWIDATVTDSATGGPVAGARVNVADGFRAHPSHGIKAVTDGDGRARFRVERGRMKVALARHPEYRVVPEWAPIGKDGTVALTLDRGETVSGLVRLPDGEPARGGRVGWRETFTDGESTTGWNRFTEIGEDGTFRATGLPAEALKFDAEVAVGDRNFRGAATLPAGTTGAEIRLAEKFVAEEEDLPIHVLVLDPDGRPVPSGRVETSRPGRWRRWHYEPSMDEPGNLREGRAVLGGPREGIGSIEVFALKDAVGRPLPWGSQRLTEIPAGDEEIVFRLTRGKEISGRVVDLQGNGLRGVAVTAVFARLDTFVRHAAVRTDAGGNFLLSGLGEAEYSLEVVPVEGFAKPDWPRVRAGDSGVLIRLPPGRTVELTVIDPEGRPLPDAEVEVQAGDGQIRIAGGRTGGNGMAHLTGIPHSGRMRLEVERPTGRRDLLDLLIDDWPATSGTVRFARAHSLRGRVIDAAGRGVPECQVTLWPAAGRSREAYTNSLGEFRFRDLPAGKVRLRARVTGLESDSPRSEEVVAAAGSEDVRLVIDPGPILRVRVMNPPVEVERVSVRLIRVREKAEPERDWTDLDDEGRCVFRGLRAKTAYVLWIGPTGDGKCYYREGVTTTAAELGVRLSPGLAISGRVVLPAGVEPESVSVGLSRNYPGADGEEFAFWLDDADVDEQGRFEFRGYPPGTYGVEVWLEVGETEYTAAGKVEAGDSVVLEPVPVPEEDDE